MFGNELRHIKSVSSAQVASPAHWFNIQRFCVVPVIVVSGRFSAVNAYKIFGRFKKTFALCCKNNGIDLKPCLPDSLCACYGAVTGNPDSIPWHLGATKSAAIVFAEKMLVFIFCLALQANIALCRMYSTALGAGMSFICRHFHGLCAKHPTQRQASILRNAPARLLLARSMGIFQPAHLLIASSRQAEALRESPWQIAKFRQMIESLFRVTCHKTKHHV